MLLFNLTKIKLEGIWKENKEIMGSAFGFSGNYGNIEYALRRDEL